MLGPVIDVLDALEHLAVVSTTVAAELAEAEQAEWACDLEPPSVRPSPTGAPSPSTCWPRPPRSCGPSSDDRERAAVSGVLGPVYDRSAEDSGRHESPASDRGHRVRCACRFERVHCRIADTPGSTQARHRHRSALPLARGERTPVQVGNLPCLRSDGEALAADGHPWWRPALAMSRTALRQDDAHLLRP
jgi:hypothetical protein